MYGSYDHMNGTDWLWMSLSMGLIVVLVGVVVFLATRLALSSRERRT